MLSRESSELGRDHPVELCSFLQQCPAALEDSTKLQSDLLRKDFEKLLKTTAQRELRLQLGEKMKARGGEADGWVEKGGAFNQG